MLLVSVLVAAVVLALLITVFVRRTPAYGVGEGKLPGGATAERPAAANGKVYIWFGSQTGTAENFAKVLGSEASKHGESAPLALKRGLKGRP
jgi:sulfite reductase alpha subunit-like flavoprotein